jgi:hypothetical protein
MPLYEYIILVGGVVIHRAYTYREHWMEKEYLSSRDVVFATDRIKLV